jgi:hypothetical protein
MRASSARCAPWAAGVEAAHCLANERRFRQGLKIVWRGCKFGSTTTHFLAIHTHRSRRVDPQTDSVSPDGNYRDDNVLADDDFFTHPPREN